MYGGGEGGEKLDRLGTLLTWPGQTKERVTHVGRMSISRGGEEKDQGKKGGVGRKRKTQGGEDDSATRGTEDRDAPSTGKGRGKGVHAPDQSKRKKVNHRTVLWARILVVRCISSEGEGGKAGLLAHIKME